MKFRNVKTGEIIEGTDEEMEEVLSELEKSGEIGDWEAYTGEPQQAEPETGRTTPEQRREYFGGGVSGALAEAFPNLAERYMQGKDSFDLGQVKAGVSDAFSLPGRLIASTVNASNLGGQGGFNLGTRSGEGTNPLGTIMRDPVTGATAPLMGPMAKGVQIAANLGARALGLIGPKASMVGRIAGAAVAGAGEGAAVEGASALMNDRELTKEGLALASAMGGGFEGAATGIQQLLQKFGKNYIKAAAQASRLGNTDREMTDKELIEFLSNPRNLDAMTKVMESGSTGRNMTPFVNDRGKTLAPEVSRSFDEAVGVLKDEPMLQQTIVPNGPGLTPTEADIMRRRNALNATDNEIYKDKTIWQPGRQNLQDQAYARDFPDGQNFMTPRRSKTKDMVYQSNEEYNLEKFADKYDNIGSAVEGARIRQGQMTDDESLLIDNLRREIAADEGVVSGYTPGYIVDHNKFLGDRMPFNDSFYQNQVVPFLESHPEGVSTEFLGEIRKLTGEATSYGRTVSTTLQDAFRGKERAALERAFSYADAPEYEVRQGYRDAIDKFADTLSDYADFRPGEVGTNAKGQRYIVGQENMKKYAYGYLKKVQDVLAKKQALTAEEIVALYGDATNVNDTVVQNAILDLLKDLKVPQGTLERFERIGGNYAMLNKARTRMKTVSNSDNPLKGTIAAPIVPQEGFNAPNAIGYRTQKKNFDLGTFTTRNDPTKTSQAVRWGFFNFGDIPRYGNSR